MQLQQSDRSTALLFFDYQKLLSSFSKLSEYGKLLLQIFIEQFSFQNPLLEICVSARSISDYIIEYLQQFDSFSIKPLSGNIPKNNNNYKNNNKNTKNNKNNKNTNFTLDRIHVYVLLVDFVLSFSEPLKFKFRKISMFSY